MYVVHFVVACILMLFILCVYTDSENEDDQNERHSIGMIILSLKAKQFYYIHNISRTYNSQASCKYGIINF
jgi:hypothetical protein